MTAYLTITAPDGTVEIMGPRGEILTRDSAGATFTGSIIELEAELDRRAAAWSARNDCFIRNAEIEPLDMPPGKESL